jgi:DNA-binding SARP family transcriptional activator
MKNIAAALRLYQALARNLDQDLGAEPPPELQQFYQQLISRHS